MRYQHLIEGQLKFSELRKRDNIEIFVNKVRNKQPHTLETGGSIILDPQEADRLESDLNSGKRAPNNYFIKDIDGNDISLKELTKTGEYGGQATVAGEKRDKISNRGDVTEGVLGAATVARLMQRPGADITLDNVINLINSTPADGGTVEFKAKGKENITDVFKLTVRLNKAAMESFLNTELLKSDNKMFKTMNQIVAFCNDARTVEAYAKFFEQNQRPDVVEIISDGISDNKGRKTDIYMVYLDENNERKIKHFDLSLKSGTTPQFGQSGGGSSLEKPSESNWEKTTSLFEVFGVDISSTQQDYLKSKNYASALTKAFVAASKDLKTKLSGADVENEAEFMKKFIDGIKRHATLNDDNVKLLQFEENKYYLLDFKKLTKIMNRDEFDLDAKVQKQSNGWPVLHIFNKKKSKQNTFMSIRPKIEGSSATKTLRHIIQKGPVMKDVTKVRSNIKK